MTEVPSTPTALAKAAPTPPAAPAPADISSGVFSGIAAFEAAQRMAQALCTSTMVPSEYRGQQGLSNSLIALEIAARMGLSPLVVMQNMTPIHGKPSWSSSFLIATVNASGRFSPLRFVFDDKNNPSCCCAVARDKATGEVLEGETISIEMAKREGWWSRPDRYGKETSKWQSMTGQMLRYRAAAFWVKVYCPEISLGLMTQEEVADVQAVVVDALEPEAAAGRPAAAIPQPITRAGSGSGAPAPAETDSDGESQATTAEAAPPQKRSSRRGAAAQKPVPSDTRTDSDGNRLPAEAPAAAIDAPSGAQQPGDRSGPAERAGVQAAAQDSEATQGELPAQQAPDPDRATGPGSQPGAPELVTTALQEIPRLASPAALENARARVNRLLAEGQLSDDAADRLWSAIELRIQQLQSTAAAAEPQQVS